MITIFSSDDAGRNRNYFTPHLAGRRTLRFLATVATVGALVIFAIALMSTTFATIPVCGAFSYSRYRFPAMEKKRWDLRHTNHDNTNKGWWMLRQTLPTTTTQAKTPLYMATPRVGLIGLPNVGKSTLFNAVSRKADLARAANFPFCTIEPNRAPIAVPDPFLRDLSRKFVVPDGDGTIRPARIELIDVAGLVEGASRGEGLGNRFLAVVRECQVIVHVLRYFRDEDVLRHESTPSDGGDSSSGVVVDPVFDAAIVDNELLLADLAHVEKRLSRIKEDKEGSSLEKIALTKVFEKALRKSIPARFAGLTSEEAFAIKSMGLLTLKPIVYAFNVDEFGFTAQREEVTRDIRTNIMPKIRSNNNDNESNAKSNSFGDDDFVLVSAKLEEDLLSLGGPSEQSEFMSELMSMGETEVGNDREDEEQRNQDLLSYNVLPALVCRLLSLSLCYTGPGVPPERSQTTKSYLFSSSSTSSEGDNDDTKETRTEADLLTAFGLAGKIHGELQKGFLRAEVIRADDLLRFDSFRQAREEGCVRTEGKDYLIEQGDTILIKWRE